MSADKWKIRLRKCENCCYYGKPDSEMSHCYRIPARYPIVSSNYSCKWWLSNNNLYGAHDES